MKIGVVLPTLPGRERVFDLAWRGFEETCPDGWEFDITVPEGYPTIGEAWNVGASEVLDSDYLFFAIDDGEPHKGWAEAAVETVDAGYIPAARLLFADGSLEACGSMGFGQLLPESPDWTPCRNTGIPFIKPEWWAEVGEFLPIHYSVDDDWNWRASLLGIRVVYRSGMVFTHHHERASTQHVRDIHAHHRAQFLNHAASLRLPESAVSA